MLFNKAFYVIFEKERKFLLGLKSARRLN